MKIPEKLVLLLLLIQTVSACKIKDSNLRRIEVSSNNITENFTSLINSYEVLPLDNKAEAYFSFSHKAILGEKNWLFCNPNEAKVIVFDNKGRFINTIGKKGRGPGEIMFINDFNYDPIENSVIIYERTKAKKYQLNGSYIGERDLGFSPSRVINFIDDQYIIEKQMPTGDAKSDFELRLVDKNFFTIDKRLPQKKIEYFGSSLYGQLIRCHVNKDYAYYFSLAGDTIFHIQNEKIYPAYLLSYDKDIFIQQIITDPNSGMNSNEKKDRYEQIHYFENNESCFVYFQDNGVLYCLVYNPETDNSRLFKDAIIPTSFQENYSVVLTNSINLEKMISGRIDPNRNKCLNNTVLDSLISIAENDFQVIIKMNFKYE